MKFNTQALEGLIGINERNLRWVHEHNQRKYFPQVDDKVYTKEILEKNRIPTPKTLGILDSFLRLEKQLEMLFAYDEFVIKPSKGRAGGGILLLQKGKNLSWKTPSGRILTKGDLITHMGNILFGVYSFGKSDDRVLVEEKIISHSFFTEYYSRGVADIRIILFREKPVMAMARIPTSQSEGKANLHQGAVGVGISLETGHLLQGSYKGQVLTLHPDSKKKLAGLQMPYWKTIKEIAVAAAASVNLTYLGIDIVLDQNRGPLILELNARPGLAIQVANGECLGKKLEDLL